MRSRNHVLEIFSTFLQFDADRPHHWAIDARLRRSMQHCLEQASQPELPDSDFWALYWHHTWQTPEVQPADSLQRLAESHLSAYLQEACFWAAKKTMLSFATTQFTLPDCFQIAIVQVIKILKGFNPKQGFSLQNYASAIFSSAIRDTLRQRREIDICTNWGLLRKVSQKRLIEALQAAGQGEPAITQYILAWTCFKSLYLPTQATANRKLPKPDAATWQAIANLYNKQPTTFPRTEKATPATIEKWLTVCAQSARVYLNPTLVSINTPKAGQDSGELLDDIADRSQDSLLSEMIAQEDSKARQSQQMQLNAVLESALAELDLPTRSLLQMYYEHQLTQQQMAAQLDMKQYTVSRRLSRARETLLTALAVWSKESLHISITTDVLNYTSTALEEWLQRHYNQPRYPATLE